MLIATLPENAAAMRGAVEKFLSSDPRQRISIKKLCEEFQLNSDEEVALALLVHPGQGDGKNESTPAPIVSTEAEATRRTGGIDVRDIKVGVSPNSIPVELPGVGPEFFSNYNLKITRMEKFGQ